MSEYQFVDEPEGDPLTELRYLRDILREDMEKMTAFKLRVDELIASFNADVKKINVTIRRVERSLERSDALLGRYGA